MIFFRHIKYLLFIAAWLAAFAAPAFASEEAILLRGVAADYIEILALPPDEQPAALRAFARRHLLSLRKIIESNSPGRSILDSRLFRSPAGWGAEQDLVFTVAVDSAFKHPKFLELLNEAEEKKISVPDKALQWMAKKSALRFEKMKISEQPGFKSILDPDTGVKFANEELRKLATEVLPHFYDSLPVRRKAKIISAVLRLPPGTDSVRQASAVLQNSGPLSQKLFQLIGRESKSPEMAAVLDALQSSVQPIPREEIVAVIESRTGKKMDELFAYFSEPINSGTIGQIHFARPHGSDEEVAVKVRRPGVKEALAEEITALGKVSEGTPNERFVQKADNAVSRELNFLVEAKNLRDGEVYISEKNGIGIAHLVNDFEVYEDFLVMKKAPGKKINKLVSIPELLKRGEAMSSLLEKWTRQAVFQDGFFHGDLHPGNLFLDTEAKNRVGYQLTLLDFGNAGRITMDQQKGFLRLASAVVMRSPEDAMAALEIIGKVPPESREAILAEIRASMQRPPTHPLNKWFWGGMGAIMQASVQNKMDIPESFMAFQRAEAFMEIELSEINRLLNKLDPRHQVKRFEAPKIFAKVIMKEFRSLARPKGKKPRVLSYQLFREVAGMWRNSAYYGRSADFCREFYRALKPPIQSAQ